jgi:hypothetical protein
LENFFAKNVNAEHFQKIDKTRCVDSIKDYLSKNFRSDKVPFQFKNDFEAGVISIIKFALQNGTDFFQFIPDEALKKIDPDIGGPFYHFAAFIILNDESIEGKYRSSLTLIQMHRD